MDILNDEIDSSHIIIRDEFFRDLQIKHKINKNEIFERNNDVKKQVDIQMKNLVASGDITNDLSHQQAEVNQIEKVKNTNGNLYDNNQQAFLLFNNIKNDCLKMIQQVREFMVLPEEQYTKVNEAFSEQGLKPPKDAFNYVIDVIKNNLQKLEENYVEMAKIVQAKTKDKENYSIQFFKMFEIIGKLIQIKDTLMHNLMNNIVQVIMITRIKIGIKEQEERLPHDVSPILLELLTMQKNLKFVHENLQFYPNLHEDLTVNDIERQLEKEREREEKGANGNIFLSNQIQVLEPVIAYSSDIIHNLIQRNQKQQALDNQPKFVEDQRKFVKEKNERFKREEQKGRKAKVDDEDEILAYSWDEEITLNKRIPILVWTNHNLCLTIRGEAERIKVENIRLKMVFDNVKLQEKEVHDQDLNDWRKRNEDLRHNNNANRHHADKLEKQVVECQDEIKMAYLRLKDTILTSEKVDDKMIPLVYNQITFINKLKLELSNLKRNTESLPKRVKRDKGFRDSLKLEKNFHFNALNNTKGVHSSEIDRINEARELNEKKNLVTDIAVKQRFEQQREYTELKEKIKQLKKDNEATSKIIDTKNKSRENLANKIDDLENENILINECIYELEQDKKNMYEEKNRQDKENKVLKKETEFDETSKYNRWKKFTETKDLDDIPDIMVQLQQDKQFLERQQKIQLENPHLKLKN